MNISLNFWIIMPLFDFKLRREISLCQYRPPEIWNRKSSGPGLNQLLISVGGAAAAARLNVGIGDLEAGAMEPVDIVDYRTHEAV